MVQMVSQASPAESPPIATHVSDRDKARQVDPSAAFTKLLRRLAREQFVPRDQVPDLVQEAWLRMLTRFPQAADQQIAGPLTAWLHCVVRSLAVDWYRKEKRRRTRCASVLLDAVQEAQPDADPSRHFDRCLDRELVGHLLRQLQEDVSPENYRLFCLHWIEEQPVAALAAAVSLGPAEISARLYRMMKKMQKFAARCANGSEIHGPREKNMKRVMPGSARRIFFKSTVNSGQA